MRYEWTWDDWRVASDSHRDHMARSEKRSAWPFSFKKVALLAAVAALGLVLLPRKMPMGSKCLVLLATAAIVAYATTYLLGVVDVIQWARYRKHIRTVADQSRSVEWGYDHERLWFHSKLIEAAYRWAFFKAIVEAPRCFLLYQGNELVVWLPLRGFASAEAIRQFTDLARARVPNYVVLGECHFPAKPEPIGLDEL